MERSVSRSLSYFSQQAFSGNNPLTVMDFVDGSRRWQRFTHAHDYRPDLTEVAEKLEALWRDAMVVYVANPDRGLIAIEISPYITPGGFVEVEWQYRKHPVVVHRSEYDESLGVFPYEDDYWGLLTECHRDFFPSEDLNAFFDEAHGYLQELVDQFRQEEGLPVGHAGVYSHGTHALQVAEMDEVHIVPRGQSLGLSLDQLSRLRSGSSRGVHVSVIDKPVANSSIADQELTVGQFFNAVLSKMYLGSHLSHTVESSDTNVATVELRRNELSSITKRVEDLILQVQGVACGTATITTTVSNPSGDLETSFEVTVESSSAS